MSVPATSSRSQSATSSRRPGPELSKLLLPGAGIAAPGPCKWLALVVLLGVCVLTPTWVGGVLVAWTPALAGCMALGLLLLLLTCRRTGTPETPETIGPWRLLAPFALPIGVMVLQLLPVPVALLRVLSPHAAALRLLLTPGAGWLPVSLDVPATLFELSRQVTLLGVGLLTMCLCGDGAMGRQSSRLLLRGLVGVGVIQGGVALVHLLQGNTKSILSIYPLPEGWESGLGTFVNHNHAAGLLVLTSGVTAGLLVHEGTERRGRVCYLLALALQLGTLFLSHSRGGVAAAALSAALFLGTVLGRRVGEGRAHVLGVGLSLLGTAAVVLCMPGLYRRLQQVWDGNIAHYEKVRVWRDTLPLLRDYLPLGVGRGAFESVFPPYRTGDEYVVVPYPASLPLQHASELGLPATLILWGLAAWLVRDLWRRRRALSAPELGAAAGVLGAVAHNLVEFSLELPGVAVPVAACVGLLLARAHRVQGSGHGQRHGGGRRTPLWPVLWPACLLMGAGAVAGTVAMPHLISAEKGELRRALQKQDPARAERLLFGAQERHPADFHIALIGASTALLLSEPPAVVLHRVNRVLTLHPADGQAHRIAAYALLRARRPGQATLEVRLAFEHGWAIDETTLAEATSLLGPAALVDALPQQPNVQLYLARYLMDRKQEEPARRARYRALVLDPSLSAGSVPP